MNINFLLSFYFISSLLFGQIYAQLTLKGDAFLNNANQQDCITLTTDDNFKSGGFWTNTPIDLNNPFEVSVTIDFGCITNPDLGGDGVAFVIQNQSSNAGINAFGGGTLGYQGISPSVAIQMDTYRENPIDYPAVMDPGGGIFNLPYYDHMSLMLNGQVNHETVEDLATVPFTPFYSDVEDCSTGNFHHVTVSWDPLTKILDVFYCSQNGNFNTISQVLDIKNNVFNGNNLAYWGFTGSTGGATNEQSVCIDFATNIPLISDTNICLGQTIDLDFSHLDYFTFDWKDQSGTTISNNPFISLNPNSNTSYQLDLINTCSGSSFTRNFNIEVSAPNLVEVVASHIDIECFGDDYGQLEVDFVNGINPIQYELSGVSQQNNGLYANLSANIYNITATDQQGCTDNINIEIVQNSELDLNIDNLIGVQCNTSNTGTLEVTPTGGVGPYNLSWTDDNGAIYNSQDLLNINDGNYNYFLIDDLNCVKTGQIVVEQLNDIGINLINLQNLDCYNTSTGEINLVPTGGLPPFTFSWTGPNEFTSDNNFISSIEAGEYFLNITDDENCYRNFEFTIDEPSPVLATSTSTPTNCFNSNDGVISTIHSGGTGSTTAFLVDNNFNFFSNTNITNNLFAGSYYTFALDDSGCSSDTNAINVDSANEIEINLTSLQTIDCNGGNNGSINTEILGGSIPYQNYSWLGPNGFTSSNQNISNLISGNYTLVVTDAYNCTKTETFLVSEPLELVVYEDNIGYVKCTGSNSGSISINLFGGTAPYPNFNWSGPNGFTSSSQNIDSLFQGDYTVNVTDNNNCTAQATFTVFEPDSILSYTSIVTKSCSIENIGTAELNIIGGVPPYAINWFDADPNALASGNNYLEITDQANCLISDSIFVDFFPNPLADFKIDTLLRKNVSYIINNKSLDGISWFWTFENLIPSQEYSPLVSYSDTGYYNIFLQTTNFFGCSDTISKKVYVGEELTFFTPNSFTPNNDFVNDKLIIPLLNYSSFKIEVFNRHGQLIYTTKDPSEGWDGTINNQKAQIGTYVMRIEIIDLFGKLHINNSEITLLR